MNEWTISKLLPHTINLVSYGVCNIKEAIGNWTNGVSALTNYTGHLVVYGSYAASLIPIPPLLQYQTFGPHFSQLSFMDARNCGLLRLDRDEIVLANHATANGDAIYSGAIRKSFSGTFGIHSNPLIVSDIKFLTHFSVMRCKDFYSGH